MTSTGAAELSPQSRIVHVAEHIRDSALSQVVRMGVAGNGGSFSEQAALRYAKGRNGREGGIAFGLVEVVWLITAEAVLKALTEKKIDYGVVAYMNNHGGPVKENMPAFAKYRWSPEIGPDGLPETVTLPIEHVLMVRPDAQASVRNIVTQRQAHEQCKNTIADRFPHARVSLYEDTATAARNLADGTLHAERPGDLDLTATGVVGPEACAELYKLKVRKRGMPDFKDSATTFVVARPFQDA